MKWTGTGGLLREPLLHFLLIGVALFLLFAWRGAPRSVPGGPAGAPSAQIAISREEVDQMVSLFERTWQRPPTQEERTSLIEDLVRNEIYYREAIAIGLDRDDAVFKRRLRQKMEFIYEDISSWAEPTEEELVAFMEQHREKYLAESLIAFRQVYINASERGAGAEPEARRVLAALEAGIDPDVVGDRTMLEAEVPLSRVSEIERRFGGELAAGLLEVAPGRWAGPIRSGYGLHLVLVRERQDGRLPEWGRVRETVQRDWTVERQRQVKDAAYAKLRERYTVTVEEPKAGAASPEPAADPGAGKP